jgi:hypothetical protein
MNNFVIIIAHGKIKTDHDPATIPKQLESTVKLPQMPKTFVSDDTHVFTLSAIGDPTGYTVGILTPTLKNMETNMKTIKQETLDGFVDVLKQSQAGLEGGFYCDRWLEHIRQHAKINPNPTASCYSQHNTIIDKYLTFHEPTMKDLMGIWYFQQNTETLDYMRVNILQSLLNEKYLKHSFTNSKPVADGDPEVYPGFLFGDIVNAIKQLLPGTLNIIDYSCSVCSAIANDRDKRAASRGLLRSQSVPNIPKKKRITGGKRRRQTKKRAPQNRRSRRTNKYSDWLVLFYCMIYKIKHRRQHGNIETVGFPTETKYFFVRFPGCYKTIQSHPLTQP